VGAIFSGIAALMIVMALIRRTMRLDQYLTYHHFNNLAKLLLLMSLLWLYFTMAENPPSGTAMSPRNAVFGARARSRYAPYFWAMVVLNLWCRRALGIRRLRTISNAVVASVCVLTGCG
jgi:molybdopterin-containing oxidoreductase family membrane subunit